MVELKPERDRFWEPRTWILQAGIFDSAVRPPAAPRSLAAIDEPTVKPNEIAIGNMDSDSEIRVRDHQGGRGCIKVAALAYRDYVHLPHMWVRFGAMKDIRDST